MILKGRKILNNGYYILDGIDFATLDTYFFIPYTPNIFTQEQHFTDEATQLAAYLTDVEYHVLIQKYLKILPNQAQIEIEKSFLEAKINELNKSYSLIQKYDDTKNEINTIKKEFTEIHKIDAQIQTKKLELSKFGNIIDLDLNKLANDIIEIEKKIKSLEQEEIKLTQSLIKVAKQKTRKIDFGIFTIGIFTLFLTLFVNVILFILNIEFLIQAIVLGTGITIALIVFINSFKTVEKEISKTIQKRNNQEIERLKLYKISLLKIAGYTDLEKFFIDKAFIASIEKNIRELINERINLINTLNLSDREKRLQELQKELINLEYKIKQLDPALPEKLLRFKQKKTFLESAVNYINRTFNNDYELKNEIDRILSEIRDILNKMINTNKESLKNINTLNKINSTIQSLLKKQAAYNNISNEFVSLSYKERIIAFVQIFLERYYQKDKEHFIFLQDHDENVENFLVELYKSIENNKNLHFIVIL